MQLALGKRVHPELPELSYIEVATAPMVIRHMDAGGIDLAILDGEATPVGGMGIAKQLKDEIDDCPPMLVLTGRPDDAWLANWSRAEAAVPHPIDPIRLGDAVVSLLAHHRLTVNSTKTPGAHCLFGAVRSIAGRRLLAILTKMRGLHRKPARLCGSSHRQPARSACTA